ncbi:diaminopimelate epimerase [Pacificibacter maritimus]|uniref:Diaminopimelate epimerase n=1 Tax=Pacificibacter maritimus TaxID=762213 RepID=A0A3N4UI22_9RHOB|nr:diaminopimelate epimerase [Pacificibacter maritimus]RPE64787.1 diaminopimelate epimerase [Pacificibacter maritimus]
MSTNQNTPRPPCSPLSFVKMHGLGNDFVIIDSRGRDAQITPALAKSIGDRNRGVGFDQLAEIRSSDSADVDLDFWNNDGSRAGACGNATRCVARLLMDETLADSITIRTERGLLLAKRTENNEVSVNMGHPILDWAQIPLSHEVDVEHLPLTGDPVAVGMGNPHAVFFVDDITAIDLAVQGSAVEHDPIFPERTNVEFAEIRSRSDIRMRVWERGSGITLACGSGACATLVAASLRGLTDKKVKMEVDGGTLTLDWRNDGVWMTGPTQRVFTASFDTSFLEPIS